jgi:tRNA isopentenyl-2-thiomethyl-A-37 hydroxylase MiaE
MSVLASRTDPAWAARALASLADVLVDHAHCEKKAASTAVSLCFRYPGTEHGATRWHSGYLRDHMAVTLAQLAGVRRPTNWGR